MATTYLTIRSDRLSDRAHECLAVGEHIDDDVLAELECVGERVADPEAYLASEGVDGWYLDEDGHSNYVRIGA